MNAQVEVIKHIDIRGNELLYLKISRGMETSLTNIGLKTFQNIEKLLKAQVNEPAQNTTGGGKMENVRK